MYVDVKSKNCLAVACLEKYSEFRGFKNQNKRNKRNKLFSNIAYFEKARSCSNATKIGVQVPQCIYFLMESRF